MKKNIIFDLDGTILNTIDDLTDACKYALKNVVNKDITKEDVLDSIGDGLINLMKRLSESDDEKIVEQCSEYFTDYYKVHLFDKTKPFDGIIDLLKDLKERKYKCYCLSNKDDYAAKLLIEKNLGDLIISTLGRKDNQPIKPDPIVVKKLLGEYSNDELIIVGDSLTDVQFIKNVGCDGIIVNWGYCKEEKLNDINIDRVNNVKELFEKIISYK